MEDIMSLRMTVHAVVVFLLAPIMAVRPISASCQNADVVPRLVAGDISGFLYTPKLSFKNLSNKQCNGIFQLLEGDFKPASGIFEFNEVRISDGTMPLSLAPGEGLSGSLKKVDSGGYQGFGFWRQTGSCVAGLDVALAADVQVGKVQSGNQYQIVDQVGLTASAHPSQRWGFAARKAEVGENVDGTAFSIAPCEARWAWALFEGKILSPGSLRKMLDFIPLSDQHPPVVGYGMGALRAIIADREYWGHGGNIFGYTTMMLYDPRERVSIAILINQDFVDYAIAPPLFSSIMNAVQPILQSTS